MLNSRESYICVPLPSYLAAELFKRYPEGFEDIIEHAVNTFLDRTVDDIEKNQPPVGIQWESIFLETGTHIRTKYFGEYKEAIVKGEQIVWDNKMYKTCAQLVNAMRGDTSNNAWKELEIRRPKDKKWLPAMILRRK